MAVGNDPKLHRVRNIMTTGVAYCFENQSIEEAEQLMAMQQVRRLVVFNSQKKLVGIVSLGDLALRANEYDQVGEVLSVVTEPSELTLA